MIDINTLSDIRLSILVISGPWSFRMLECGFAIHDDELAGLSKSIMHHLNNLFTLVLILILKDERDDWMLMVSAATARHLFWQTANDSFE